MGAELARLLSSSLSPHPYEKGLNDYRIDFLNFSLKICRMRSIKNKEVAAGNLRQPQKFLERQRGSKKQIGRQPSNARQDDQDDQ